MEMEDPLMEEDHLDPPGERKTTCPSRTPWTSKTYNSPDHQVLLDTTALENTFNSVGWSMLQLARAHDQTNRQL